MPERRRRQAPVEDIATVGRETKMSKVEERGNDEPMVVLDGQGVEMEKEVRRLRERWELASVLNFLCVSHSEKSCLLLLLMVTDGNFTFSDVLGYDS